LGSAWATPKIPDVATIAVRARMRRDFMICMG